MWVCGFFGFFFLLKYIFTQIGFFPSKDFHEVYILDLIPCTVYNLLWIKEKDMCRNSWDTSAYFDITGGLRDINTDDFIWLSIRHVANFLFFQWNLVCTPGFRKKTSPPPTPQPLKNQKTLSIKHQICANLSLLFRHFILRMWRVFSCITAGLNIY